MLEEACKAEVREQGQPQERGSAGWMGESMGALQATVGSQDFVPILMGSHQKRYMLGCVF